MQGETIHECASAASFALPSTPPTPTPTLSPSPSSSARAVPTASNAKVPPEAGPMHPENGTERGTDSGPGTGCEGSVPDRTGCVGTYPTYFVTSSGASSEAWRLGTGLCVVAVVFTSLEARLGDLEPTLGGLVSESRGLAWACSESTH